MIGICPQCGNYDWDKEVSENTVRCPKCGHTWPFRKAPIYFLSGCSGIGKTTTAQALMQLTDEYVILDADMFHAIMQPKTQEDYQQQVEQIFSLTKNLNQAGKPVLWTMAGNLDKLPHSYGTQFFSEIKVLALTVEENLLRHRMTVGRGIHDEGWIQSSVDYNEYFKTHTMIGDTAFETLDCSYKTPEEVARQVLEWLKKQ